MLEHNLRHALDPVLFAREALGFTPDAWQEQALRSPSKRILYNCHRQAGKSTVAAIKTLHRTIFVPGCLVLLFSPSQRQSGELLRRVYEQLDRLKVRPKLDEGSKLSLETAEGSRVVSLPSTEATVRGYSGASLIIEDEAARVTDELHYATRPMLAVSGGDMMLMSTPWGKRGHFHHEWTEGLGWERVLIPATENPRIAPEFLAEMRASLSERAYRQDFLCEFVDVDEQVFSYEDIMAAVSTEVKPLFGGDSHGPVSPGAGLGTG